jgi:DNA-binding MarR family transcriptional regulator
MANTITIDKFYDTKSYLTPIQSLIIKSLMKEGPMHRKQLVSALNTPRTTIYDNLLKLQKRKLIKKTRDNNGERGRPLVYWEIK